MKLVTIGSFLLVLAVIGCAAPAIPTPVPPATLVPQTTAPQTAAPQTAAPQTAAPQTAAPQTATPVQPTVAKPTDTPPPTATEPPTATFVPTSTPRPTETFTPAPTATATRTPQPTATSTPATETYVIFSDDFSASKCNLTTGENTSRKYACENGEYSMEFKNPEYGGWVWYGDSYDNAVIEADARAISGDQVLYGIIFRRTTDGDYYRFALSQGAYALQLYSGQKWTALIPWTNSPAVKAGAEKNHLKVVVQGTLIALYANNEFLQSFEDSTLPKGSAGLYAANTLTSDKVAFDNFAVSKINRPLALPGAKPTATPIPTIPPGMGGLIVVNFTGDEVYYDIAGKRYTVAPNSQIYIHLPPGRYGNSGTAAGKKYVCTTSCEVDIRLGVYETTTFN